MTQDLNFQSNIKRRGNFIKLFENDEGKARGLPEL